MLTSSWVFVGSSQVIKLGSKVFKLEELKVLEIQKIYFKIETKVSWNKKKLKLGLKILFEIKNQTTLVSTFNN